MKTLGNIVIQENDIEFIRAGLAAVSGKGRRALKEIAQTLADAQKRRGNTRRISERRERFGR
jgi:hypothetical protein